MISIKLFYYRKTQSVFFGPMSPHVLVDFVVLPHGHGRSVTDFWGWDAHEEQLRCPDDVSGDIGGCSARRALKPKFYQPTQTMITAGILPFRENSDCRTGNRTRDHMISSQETLTTRPRGWSGHRVLWQREGCLLAVCQRFSPSMFVEATIQSRL